MRLFTQKNVPVMAAVGCSRQSIEPNPSEVPIPCSAMAGLTFTFGQFMLATTTLAVTPCTERLW